LIDKINEYYDINIGTLIKTFFVKIEENILYPDSYNYYLGTFLDNEVLTLNFYMNKEMPDFLKSKILYELYLFTRSNSLRRDLRKIQYRVFRKRIKVGLVILERRSKEGKNGWYDYFKFMMYKLYHNKICYKVYFETNFFPSVEEYKHLYNIAKILDEFSRKTLKIENPTYPDYFFLL
jgi:hypothetical protein